MDCSIAPLRISYPRGTFCAGAGFILIAVYYDYAWRRLKNGPADLAVSSSPGPAESGLDTEIRYMLRGIALSILSYLLAGAADAPSTALDRLVGASAGFCGFIFAAMFGVGLVSLWNLWAESIQQVKSASRLKRLAQSLPQPSGSDFSLLLRSLVVAISWLAVGFAAILGAGMLVGKIPHWLDFALREAMWFVIAAAFYALWKSRHAAALLLRILLLFVFSAIILVTLVFSLWWVASQLAPLLVTFLAAIVTLDAIFYHRWVRFKALETNFE